MREYKASEIERITWNGKPKIKFDLLENKRDHWLFCGSYTAPAGTPRGELIGHALECIETEELHA